MSKTTLTIKPKKEETTKTEKNDWVKTGKLEISTNHLHAQSKRHLRKSYPYSDKEKMEDFKMWLDCYFLSRLNKLMGNEVISEMDITTEEVSG